MSKLAHSFQDKARTGDVVISEAISFDSLLLSKPVLNGLKNSGFEIPSPIQLKAIPLGRCGLDLIVQAKSGTGKTCVFSVVALETVLTDTASTQILVLAPTREIAVQIWEVIRGLGSAMKGLECHMFIGGLPLHEDRMKLKKCHIAVGTPGRIKQLIEGGVLLTDSIRLFILDEADKLLEESFQEQINWIYSMLPDNKQMLALSATYPEYLADHLTAYMRNPTFLRLNIADPALLGIRQFCAAVPYHPISHAVFEEKTKSLVHLLSSVSFQQCLIFSNLQTRAQNLADVLNSKGWPTACIAGCLDQKDRNHAMAKLKTYKCRILISTDLTSRGIDADKVNLVVNLDVPKDHETYLHRIGRAGRFGSFGIAVTLVSEGQEQLSLDSIQKRCNTQIHPLPDPLPSDLTNPGTPVYLDHLVSSEVINTDSRHQVRKAGLLQPLKSADGIAAKYDKPENAGTLSLETQSCADLVSADTSNTALENDSDPSEEIFSCEAVCEDITRNIKARSQDVLAEVGQSQTLETLKPDASHIEFEIRNVMKMETYNKDVCEKPQSDRKQSEEFNSETKYKDLMSSSKSVTLRNCEKWNSSQGKYTALHTCSVKKLKTDSMLCPSSSDASVNDSHHQSEDSMLCTSSSDASVNDSHHQSEEAEENHGNSLVNKSRDHPMKTVGVCSERNSEITPNKSPTFCKNKFSIQCQNIKELDLVQLFQSKIGFQSLSKTCSYTSCKEAFAHFKENGDNCFSSALPEMVCSISSASEQTIEALELRKNIADIQEALNKCGRFSQIDVTEQKHSINEDDQTKPFSEIPSCKSNTFKPGMDSTIKSEITSETDDHIRASGNRTNSKLEDSPPAGSRSMESKYETKKTKARPKAAGYRNKFAVAYLMEEGFIKNEENLGVEKSSLVNGENEKQFKTKESITPLSEDDHDTSVLPNLVSTFSKQSVLHERLNTDHPASRHFRGHAEDDTEDSSEDSLSDSFESDSVTDDEDSASENLAQNTQKLEIANSACSSTCENKNSSLRQPSFKKASTHSFHARNHRQESKTVHPHFYEDNEPENVSNNDSKEYRQKTQNDVEYDYGRRMQNWHNEYQSWCARFQVASISHYPHHYGQGAVGGPHHTYTYPYPYPYWQAPTGEGYPCYPRSCKEGARNPHSENVHTQLNDDFEIQNRYFKEMSQYVWNNRLKK